MRHEERPRQILADFHDPTHSTNLIRMWRKNSV
jgi:hypothetical protein